MTINFFILVIFQVIQTILVIKYSKKFNLLDYPNTRKTHKYPTPFTGGIVLILNFILIIFISDFENKNLNFILSYGILIALGGFLDDRYSLNPGSKIIFQILPIYFLIEQGISLYDLGYYDTFGVTSLGSLAKIFTLLCCLLLVNAYNYSDGIDGLLTTICISTLFFFNIYYFHHNQWNMINEYFSYIMLSLFIFLIFNVSNNKKFKIFLGDSGSNLLGFIVAFTAIHLYMEENMHPSILIWPLAFIVFEFLSVNISRLINNKKIFKPGKDHLHYQLKNKYKLSNFQIIIFTNLINVTFGLIGLLFNNTIYYEASILSFIISFFIFHYFKTKLFS